MTSCEDDPILDSGIIGDGEAVISAEVSFKPLVSALNSRAVEGGTSGKTISEINNLHIFVYDQTGSTLIQDISVENPIIGTNTATSSDADKSNQAESETKKASFRVALPYGKFKIYAVANVAETDLTDENIASETALKNINLNWHDDIAYNGEMFGYFTTGDKSAGFEAPVITVDKPALKLRAWLKRAASKVTVAFDGTGLKDGVEIFIKSVQIKDIPSTCYLGKYNPYNPYSSDSSTESNIDDNTGQPSTQQSEGEIILISDPNEIITYYPDGITGQANLSSDDYDQNWPGYISKAHPINGYDQGIVNNSGLSTEEKLNRLHSENTNALYFYENMQGLGKEGTPTDKRQQVADQHVTDKIVSYPNGVDPTNIAWKDAKKYGSYIEVQAYYKSHDEQEGEGPITYRFMLGKDTQLDYNAERNYHYKLTLKFKGWANDVDWHIDYKKDKTKLRFPHPFYISYLYGQTAMIPLEFDAPESVTIKEIKAEIVSNNWWPMDCSNPYTADRQPDATDYDEYYKYVGTANVLYNKPWNGFLSLKKPKNLLVLEQPNPVPTFSDPSMLNQDHYEKENLGNRTYSEDELKVSDRPLYEAADNDKAHVSWDNGTYYVKIPIWTRARQMITATGYTGSNPYDAYYREASVKIVVTLSDGTTLDSSDLAQIGGLVTTTDTKLSPNIQVKQVRRLVNPKGIYRSKENHDPFRVVLKVLESDNDATFTDLKSDGQWRAYIIRDSEADKETGTGGFVSLTANLPSTTTADYTFEYRGEVLTRKSLEGVDGSTMDFTVNFSGPASKPRYAIIRVEYNYCSCYHLIFVRQGYEADDTFGTGTKWCTGNNIDQNTVAQNPLQEGSLFRFGNWNGIPSTENTNSFAYNKQIKPNDFIGNAYNSTAWENMASASTNPENTEFKAGSGRRIAGLEDFQLLAPEPEKLNDDAYVENFPIKTGYGVCYGDGATVTASTVADAFGYNENGANSNKGMRGCFVYDVTTGGNLFFPIGNSGFGHRKSKLNVYDGVLRYSVNSRWGYFDAKADNGIYQHGVFNAPLFLDIFRANGAIYWFNKGAETKDYNHATVKFVGWDINFSTYDFAGIALSNVYSADNGADACFVRCIEE
ncbi:MAG: hypothetical protein K2K40_06940 [Paramuribaculum sp.]|nr:hypothetical protein [Paramuribaculum sp.]